MKVPALLLLATLSHPDTLSLSTAPDVARGEVLPAAVIVHHQPAIPIVSLRVSILADDPPGYSGAGHLIQHLHLPRLREQARRVGGQVQIWRNSDAIVYTVTGPAAELDYLGSVLLSALRVPTHSPGEMVIAIRDLREERLAEWETAAGHVRSHLRARLFPEDLSAAGTERSSDRLAATDVRVLWGELYRPDRVSVVAVGDVSIGEVERVFSDLPAPPTDRLAERFRDTIPAARVAPAEATRGWLGLAYPVDDLDPTTVTVTARLLSDQLRARLPTSEVAVEHWWTHHGQALVAIVAAPEENLAAARREIGTAMDALQRTVTEREVRAAATATRREMLFHSRTPDQMAEVVGRFADRDGDPDAAQGFFARLDSVRLSDVESFLDRLADRTAVRVDVPPQALQRR